MLFLLLFSRSISFVSAILLFSFFLSIFRLLSVAGVTLVVFRVVAALVSRTVIVGFIRAPHLDFPRRIEIRYTHMRCVVMCTVVGPVCRKCQCANG